MCSNGVQLHFKLRKGIYFNVAAKVKIHKEVELKNHTTIKIGGRAENFVVVNTQEQLYKALSLPYTKTILGGGSNALISDKGIGGLVIKMAICEIYIENGTFTATAGVSLPTLSSFALQHGIDGFSWAGGIPATVGGAIKMNAGAFGENISNSLLFVYVLRGGKVISLQKYECGFSYRHTQFEKEDIILKAVWKIKSKETQKIETQRNSYLEYRRLNHPQEPSCGSVFKGVFENGEKRPTSAGYFIEKAGLKGIIMGGAQISQKHANFIINKYNASSADVINLIDRIKTKVYNRFQIILEEEIVKLGEF